MRSRSYKAILKLCVTENGMSEETERVTELTSDPRGDGAGQQGQGVVPFLNFSFLHCLAGQKFCCMLYRSRGRNSNAQPTMHAMDVACWPAGLQVVPLCTDKRRVACLVRFVPLRHKKAWAACVN